MSDGPIRFRSFRNSDPPALTTLWNQGVPIGGAAARPLSIHEFETDVLNHPHFDANGLIVALDQSDQARGFAHIGFGPFTDWTLADGSGKRTAASHGLGREIPPAPTSVGGGPISPRPRLDRSWGTVAMMVFESPHQPPSWAPLLLAEAHRRLRAQGAEVIYAGGAYPLNPFYWGCYGGGEFSGVLSSHQAFHQTLEQAGYRPTQTSILFEADCFAMEPRDPRAAVIRRDFRFEIEEDFLAPDWWRTLALSERQHAEIQLCSRRDHRRVARAAVWDMEAFGREDGLHRYALIDLVVDPDYRRRGLARFLVVELLKYARLQYIDRLCVQTDAANQPALALYHALGFKQVETSRFYRLDDRGHASAENPGDQKDHADR